MTKKLILIFITLFLLGCGYTTRSLIDPQYRTVYVKPVVNAVKVTGETQEFSKYRSVPPFLEQAFTRSLLERFSLDGNLKVVKEYMADLVVECTITDYVQSTLRYDDDERVEEYRLKMFFSYKVLNRGGDIVRKGNLVANGEYALVGELATSEDRATASVLEDASRKLVDEIIEEW